MGRKEITDFLRKLLARDRFSGAGKYWASEVTVDYGSNDVRRVDFMQFIPVNQYSISGLEKGVFCCYEVKSCKADFNSGFGKNFIAEKNYFVMPMALYKEVINDLPYGVGVLCPVPCGREVCDEFESPTPLDTPDATWALRSVRSALSRARNRSITELLFCMLRSGH